MLDNHDGELVPSLEVRMQIIRQIRAWDAGYRDRAPRPARPNDYHPDHRYTGILVQDASYMVTVPNLASDTPPTKKNPLFLYFSDRFKRPQAFRPDIVVSIDDVIDKKYAAPGREGSHVSQFYEWLPWHAGRLDEVPRDPAGRLAWLKSARSFAISDAWREAARARYGAAADSIEHAEAFEITEYGLQPSEGTGTAASSCRSSPTDRVRRPETIFRTDDSGASECTIGPIAAFQCAGAPRIVSIVTSTKR